MKSEEEILIRKDAYERELVKEINPNHVSIREVVLNAVIAELEWMLDNPERETVSDVGRKSD